VKELFLIINIAGEMVKLKASKQAQGSKEEHPAKTLGHPQTGLSGAS